VRRALVVLAALLVPATARAGGFEVAQQGTAADGTGHAGVARDDDASIAHFNPAAAADGEGLRLAVGIALAFPSIHAEATDGSWQADSESAPVTPPHLYASYARDEWAAGLAANVAFGSGVEWPADWPGRFEIVSSEVRFFRFAPFFAWRFGDVSLAAGLHVDAGSLRIARSLDFIDVEGNVIVLLSGWGLGGHAALHWRASDTVDLGLRYVSRSPLSLSGDANFTTPDEFQARAPDQHATADWTLPDRLVAGVSVQAGALRLVGDVGVTMWQVNDELVIDFENEMTPDAVQHNDWSAAVAVRAGAEYVLEDRWTLRAGGYFDGSPANEQTLAPSSPDSDRVGFTLGAGAALGDFRIDLFYELLFLLGAESRSDDAQLARYSGVAHVVGLGVQWHPAPAAPE
jgi:long-chain fatty acid transport protein